MAKCARAGGLAASVRARAEAITRIREIIPSAAARSARTATGPKNAGHPVGELAGMGRAIGCPPRALLSHRVSRRTLLMLAGGAAVGGGCSSPGVGPTLVGDLQGGNVSDLPLVSLRVVPNEPVCLGRDWLGIYAMTLTCTHAGCDIGQAGSVSARGLVCGCHGSAFDANGNVVRGPATQPLDHLGVSVDARGELTIHGDQIVSASERLKV